MKTATQHTPIHLNVSIHCQTMECYYRLQAIKKRGRPEFFPEMPHSPQLETKGVLPVQEEEADKHRMLCEHIQVFHIC